MKTIITSIVLALAIGITVLPPSAQSQPPAAARTLPKQAPGYYKWTLGDFAITSLSDGTLDIPVDQLLHGPGPDEVAIAFRSAFAKLPMEMSVNAFLIDTGAQLILVDTGSGSLFGPSLGRVRKNLVAAGYRPEQVDMVLLTHIHGDHSGGLLVKGRPAFPNAKVRVAKADLDYFTDPANQKGATGLAEANFEAAKAVSSAYQGAGHLMPYSEGGEIVPGVRAVPAPGHSPGHTVYMIESKGQKLMLLGDLVHVPQVQFAHPDYTMAFDLNEGEGRTVRKAFLKEAAQQGQWIAGAHLPFPGIGHVTAQGASFTYIPAEYSANR